MRELIDLHIAEGTDAIVVVGTTGESPTVDLEEHCELIRVTRSKQAAGRVPVIAGTGANSTSEAIELASCAKKAGADAALSVVPYYNKPTQEGLYRHFKAIAEAVDMPHDPVQRAGTHRGGHEQRHRAAPGADPEHRRHQGCDRQHRARQRSDPRARRKDFAIYSGDDATGLACMLLGGQGVISVTANVAPQLMHEMCVAALPANWQRAREINCGCCSLHTQPVRRGQPDTGQVGAGGKWARFRRGMRLPLTPLSPRRIMKRLRSAMRHAGIACKERWRARITFAVVLV